MFGYMKYDSQVQEYQVVLTKEIMHEQKTCKHSMKTWTEVQFKYEKLRTGVLSHASAVKPMSERTSKHVYLTTTV